MLHRNVNSLSILPWYAQNRTIRIVSPTPWIATDFKRPHQMASHVFFKVRLILRS